MGKPSFWYGMFFCRHECPCLPKSWFIKNMLQNKTLGDKFDHLIVWLWRLEWAFSFWKPLKPWICQVSIVNVVLFPTWLFFTCYKLQFLQNLWTRNSPVQVWQMAQCMWYAGVLRAAHQVVLNSTLWAITSPRALKCLRPTFKVTDQDMWTKHVSSSSAPFTNSKAIWRRQGESCASRNVKSMTNSSGCTKFSV